MRQRGNLLGALLLHPPLALQAVGQFPAHRLHGLQRGGKLSQVRAVRVNALGLLRGDGVNRAVQPGGLGGKDPHGAVGLPAQPNEDEHRQKQNIAGLEIRQRVPQGRVGVGRSIVVLQKAKASVSHFDIVLVPRIAAAAVKGIEGNFQMAVIHVGLQHRVILHHSPAAQVTDLVGIKCFSGHGGHSLPGIGAGLGGRHGRQQKTAVYQLHKNDPPEYQNQRTSAAAQKEIPQQNTAQGCQFSFCHW